MSNELRGIPAAGGLARGLASQWADTGFEIPSFAPTDLDAEKTRLVEARQKAEAQLHALSTQVSQKIGEAEAALFEAQAMFLNDGVLVSKAVSAIDLGVNAEKAWHQACEYFAAQLESLPDETFSARSADVRDVGRRVIEILTGSQPDLMLANHAIILARELSPSQTATLDTSRVLAFCTAEGGPTSHSAILAKALGIPAVVGVGDKILEIVDGTILLVDGMAGLLISNPTSEQVAEFDQRKQIQDEKREQEKKLASQPAITTDGHRVEIVANIGSVEDTHKALEFGAEGIGLLRTEFLFLNRDQAPDEEAQFTAYSTILDLMESRPVIVRTLDVGGDKEVPYLDLEVEANPFLGYRAIRISLDRPEDFKSQLRALLRAGVGHDLRIMFPMIATLGEFRQAKELLEEAKSELKTEGIEAAEKLQVGIMVEIPAVALLADQFAAEVDFFSIGTNDLTQYTFAAERGNKHLSHLNDPCHPAILFQIDMVIRAAHAQGKWVGVCGEMASDLDAIPLLVGLGVDELSVTPSQLPSVKEAVRKYSYRKFQTLSQRSIKLDSAKSVRKLVSKD